MEKIFQEVVKIVSEGTGINGNDLIHSKKEECVDARYRLKSVKQLLEVWHDWRRVRGAGCPFIFIHVYLLLFLTIINNVIP